MRKATGFICLICMMIFLACGPSKTDEDREAAIEDSIADIDRQSVLDNANALLTDSIVTDTTTSQKD